MILDFYFSLRNQKQVPIKSLLFDFYQWKIYSSFVKIIFSGKARQKIIFFFTLNQNKKKTTEFLKLSLRDLQYLTKNNFPAEKISTSDSFEIYFKIDYNFLQNLLILQNIHLRETISHHPGKINEQTYSRWSSHSIEENSVSTEHARTRVKT